MGFLLIILGLVWWFPIGLFILAAFLVSRALGHWHRPQFAGGISGQRLGQDASGKAGWWIGVTSAPRAPEIGGINLQADNRAFDEYRAETLRRLEDEQREFKEFLQRLRIAKDRAELDQFLSERPKRLEGPQS